MAHECLGKNRTCARGLGSRVPLRRNSRTAAVLSPGGTRASDCAVACKSRVVSAAAQIPSVSSSGTVTGMPVEIDRQAAAVIDALAAVRSRRPSMTRTIRNCQLTAGQEIDVLVVSRAEAATALATARVRPNSLGCASRQGQSERSPIWPKLKVAGPDREKAPAKPRDRKRLRAASRQVANGPLSRSRRSPLLASGGSACQHRGERGAFRVGGSFPAP